MGSAEVDEYALWDWEVWELVSLALFGLDKVDMDIGVGPG